MLKLTFEPLTSGIGAVVHGAEISDALDHNLIGALREALAQHLVLVFPKQDISPAEHVALGRAFGTLEPRNPLYPIGGGEEHIMLIENGNGRPPDNDVWHADMTYKPAQPHCSVLQAKILPPKGGDTMFANMCAVLEDLSDSMQSFLGTLNAVHDVRTGFFHIFERNGETERMQAMNEMDPADAQTIHPVVATHPVSGRRYLNVNAAFTNRIVELDEDESRMLLAYLFDRIKSPLYHVRHRWSENDIVVWDNLATQHYAVADYADYRRMHRVTVRQFHHDVTASAA